MKPLEVSVALFASTLVMLCATVATATQPSAREQVIGLGKPVKSDIPADVLTILRDKTTLLVQENKMGKTTGYVRFMLRPEMAITTKAVAGKHSATLNTMFFLIDLLKDELVVTKVELVLKGAGATPIDAQKAAISAFDVHSAACKKFAAEVKAKIAAYYTANCEENIKIASEKVKQGQCSEALEILAAVPPDCPECCVKTARIITEYKNGRCKGAPKYYNISANASVDGVTSATRAAAH